MLVEQMAECRGIRTQHATLDPVALLPVALLPVALLPVALLRDIRAAQQALIEIADFAPTTTSDAPPLEAFLEGLEVAWRSTDDVRPTARPKPAEPRYRTVPDPLDAVTGSLKAWFDADPGVTGRQLLDRLQVDHPGSYPDNLVRTVQRRLKAWRRERASALVMSANDTDGASGELFGEALRWLRAPRPAKKPPAPTDALTETGVVAASSQ